MRSSMIVRWLGAAAAVLFLLGAGTTSGVLTSASDNGPLELELAAKVGGAGDSGNGKNNGVGNEKKVILVSGAVQGLYPGAIGSLELLLQNDNNFDVAVVRIDVEVDDASADCTADNIRVEGFQGSRVVPRNGTATQALVARMANDAPDECKNVVWPLTYTGRAVKP